MSQLCRNGHTSQTTDYCDQCGIVMRAPGSSTPAPSTPASSTPAPPVEFEGPSDTAPCLPLEPCPQCGAPRSEGDRFCETCGYDLVADVPAAAAPDGSSPDEKETWELSVQADREYFARFTGGHIDFPTHYPPRSFLLEDPEISIGRQSASRGTRPQIDLAGAPEDPAISHLHAILMRQHDGTYAIVDPGSSNGTTINGGSTSIPVNTPVTLGAGDRVHIGAWTTLTVHVSRA